MPCPVGKTKCSVSSSFVYQLGLIELETGETDDRPAGAGEGKGDEIKGLKRAGAGGIPEQSPSCRVVSFCLDGRLLIVAERKW